MESRVNDTKKNTLFEKADARFMATQKKMADRTRSSSESLAEAKARDAKTARLRALRLARDEELRAAEALNPPAPKRTASRKKDTAV